MNFPKLTRTKTEALQFAAEIFPGQQDALAQFNSGTILPRYQLTHETADRLRAILFWLHEEQPRIYKRARRHLFNDLAHRVVIQLDENAQAKVHEFYAKERNAAWQRAQAAQLMTGDGQGI